MGPRCPSERTRRRCVFAGLHINTNHISIFKSKLSIIHDVPVCSWSSSSTSLVSDASSCLSSVGAGLPSIPHRQHQHTTTVIWLSDTRRRRHTSEGLSQSSFLLVHDLLLALERLAVQILASLACRLAQLEREREIHAATISISSVALSIDDTTTTYHGMYRVLRY